MVLVHDDDLKCIENAVPPLETLQPDALMGFLRDYAPTIRQFQCGEYYYNSKGPFLMEYTRKNSLQETIIMQKLREQLLP